MKSLIKNTIISQAISLGFNFNGVSSDIDMHELNQLLLDFFNENAAKLPQLEDECEVTSHGRSQNVNYGDYTSSGEIVDCSAHWHKSPDTKVFHSDFVMEDTDGIMKNMNLYYLVGETDYNAPEGYIYSHEDKKHIKDHEQDANAAIRKLNELYGESIFSLKSTSNQNCAVVINEEYRYEGNDVDITFSDDGIVGCITGSTVQFASIEDLVQNIDKLFINE